MRKFYVFFILLIFIMIFGYIKDQERYRTEDISVVFTIQKVKQVKYSNESDLRFYTYLKAPNGSEVTVEDKDLYELTKKRIGQEIELMVKEKYYLSKNEEKKDITHQIIYPLKIIRFVDIEIQNGDETEYVEVKEAYESPWGWILRFRIM